MNKIKYGLSNVHYAPITTLGDGLASTIFATPVHIPGGVSLSISPVGDTASFFADNIEYFTSVVNNGYDGTVEIALVPESFETDVLGAEISTTDKVMTENSNVLAKPCALLFEFEGDVKKTRHVLYNVNCSRPNIEGNTKSTNIEAKTDTLNIKVRPLADGAVKAKTSDGTTQAAYDGWYAKVWVKDSGAGV
ncbi:MAG: phage tail protein [Angelakisella sp.]